MAEMVDVYDCEGRPTGRSIPRDGAVMPAGEYLHYATAVVRDMEGRFLITQRPMTKSWAAGWWELPGGGVRAGETPLEGCIREVREEIGLDVSQAPSTLLYRYRNDDASGDNYFMDIYEFRLDFCGADVRIQEEEIQDFAIATWDDVVACEQAGEFLHFRRLACALGASTSK
ncbi:MAG: NUDIX hydrolase [Eggerthellales bacterium]|nr:NUDIX hydrolase [Eggerthellales bacterium]